MANSYVNYTATAGQTVFTGVNFPGGPALTTTHIKAYVNGVLRSCTVSGSLGNPTITLSSAASAGDIVRIARVTPATASTRYVDFTDGDVLTATDLDNALLNALYAAQEAQDTGGGALPYDTVLGTYDAGTKRIINVSTPTGTNDAANKTYVDSNLSTAISTAVTLSGTQYTANNKVIANLANPASPNDAVTKAYVDALSVYGGAVVVPQSWTFTLNNTTDWVDQGNVGSSSRYRCTKQLTGLLSYDQNSLIVSVGGVLQTPGSAYTLTSDSLSLYAAAPTATTLTVRNFGVSRSSFAPATSSFLGSVKIGNGITVQQDGTISIPTLSTVATSGAYADLTGKPTLGTASALDIPSSGDAATGQVVNGSDSRLTDTRNPKAHTHAIADITNLQTSLNGKMSVAGGTFTGAPQYTADPSNNNDLARKVYVDTTATAAATAAVTSTDSNAWGTINATTVSFNVSSLKVGRITKLSAPFQVNGTATLTFDVGSAVFVLYAVKAGSGTWTAQTYPTVLTATTNVFTRASATAGDNQTATIYVIRLF
jgi:hypothetical protein